MAAGNVELSINQFANYTKEWRERKGFYTPSSLEEAELLLGKLMLVVTEVSEAAEAVRHKDMANFMEELADTFIRLMDITSSLGIDIETAIRWKMMINEGRDLLHGKKVAI